ERRMARVVRSERHRGDAPNVSKAASNEVGYTKSFDRGPDATDVPSAMNESLGDALDDRQQRTSWNHTAQSEARLAIEAPKLLLGSFAAPATHQHSHVGGQDRDVLPRIRGRLRDEGVDAEQPAERWDCLPAEAEDPQRVVVVPAVQYSLEHVHVASAGN